jgi:type II secretory pathway component PulC
VTGAFAQAPSTSAESPEPLHGLQLAGTVEGRGQQLTGAVFEDPRTKQQRVYRIGDLVDGATIVEIRHQQVVLKRGEERVVVRITGGSPVERVREEEPSPGAGLSIPAGDPQLARQFVISKVIPAYDPRVKELEVTVSRKNVDRFSSYFQEQMKDERLLLVTTPIGSAIDLSGVDSELLGSLGLESTDRVVSINGMGVDSPDRLRQILEILNKSRMNRGTVFNMVVLRGETIQPLYFGVQS